MADNQAVIEFVGSVEGLKPLADALKALGQLSEEQEAAFNSASKAYQDFLTKSSTATQATVKDVAGLNNALKQIPEAVAGATVADGVKKIGTEAKTATESTERLITKMRNLRDQLGKLEPGSAQFNKIAKEAGELNHRIQETNKLVQILGSRTKNLDALLIVARGIAGAFSAAQGAAALFGSENENIQKSILKVQAALALLQGIQELSNLATERSLILKTAEITAIEIYTAVVGASEIVLASFLAVATVGLSVLAAGIILVVNNWEKFAQVIGLADSEFEKLVKRQRREFDEEQKIRNQQAEEKAAQSKQDISDLNDRLKKQKEVGASTQEIFNQEQAIKEKELEAIKERNLALFNEGKALEKRRIEVAAEINFTKKGTKERIAAVKELDDIQDKLAKNNTERTSVNTELSAKEAEQNIASIAREKEALREKLRANIENINAVILADQEGSKKQLEDRKKLVEAQAELDKNAAKDIGSPQERAAKTLDIERKKNADLLKLETDFIKAKEQLDLQIAATDFVQSQVESTGKLQDLWNKRVDIIRQANIQIAAIQAEAAKTPGGLSDAQQAKIDSLLANQTLAIKNNDLEVAAFKNAQREADIASEAAHLKAIQNLVLNDPNSSPIAKRAASIELIRIEDERLNKEKLSLQQQLNDKLISQQDYTRQVQALDDQIAANKEKNDQIEKARQKEIKDAAIQVAQDVASAIFQITAQQRQAETDAAIAQLEKEKEQALKNKDLTESQKDAINEKFRKREAKIKEDAFKADKKAKIEEAIINTALAIVKALPNFILAGLAAAAGAAQIAVIASQPVPKFARGTKSAPGSMALVGEEGAELTYIPKGAKVIPHPQTMKILQGHADSAQILSNYNIPAMPDLIRPRVIDMPRSKQAEIDYDRLAKAIGKELKESPRYEINVDNTGVTSRIITGLSERSYINKRYSL